MIKNYAILKNNIVDNIIVIEENDFIEFSQSSGLILVDIFEHPDAQIGSEYVGGIFYPPTPESTPEVSPEETLRLLTNVIQNHLDTKAQERNYDNIISLCSYAASTSLKFQAEGQAGVAWRDACWTLGYQIMDEVLAGTRDIPTSEELLAEMPEFIWPDV